MFLNVDLELESTHDLHPLAVALGSHVVQLERPAGRVAFELSTVNPIEPDLVIREFARLVAALPPPAREAWDRASRRVFDIGLQSGQEGQRTNYTLSSSTLQAIAAIGAALAVTVYAMGDSANDAG